MNYISYCSIPFKVIEAFFCPTYNLGMFGYSLKHPIKKANHLIRNNQELTSLTLSCKLGRDTMFQDMLEMSCVEFWRYSNITCCGYPLGRNIFLF